MADGFSATADTSKALVGLERLVGENREHLARSMAVAGGKVFRDEAKARAPVGGDLSLAEHQHGESNNPGTLKASIYLAYKSDVSTHDEVVYSVTWNKKLAPHGHLIEFGHHQVYRWYIGKDGEYHTDKAHPLPEPRWIAAHPFLRPAFDAAYNRAYAAMIARGRERLPELLSVGYEPGSESLQRAE